MKCAAVLLLVMVTFGIAFPHAAPDFCRGAHAEPLLGILDVCHAPDNMLSVEEGSAFLHREWCIPRPFFSAQFLRHESPSLAFSVISRRNDPPPQA